jgi:hypothetical protein
MKHYNNPALPLALLLLLLATAARTTPARHASQMGELSKLTLHHQEHSYHLPVTVNHHSVRLEGELGSGRSWMKEALCKECEL